LRNTLDISDIDGSKAKKDPYLDYETRPSNKIEDIEGTKSKQLHRKRSRSPEGYDHMDYTDITKDIFKSRRSIDPLNPEYQVRDSEDKLVKIGKVEGSSPQNMHKERKESKNRDFAVKTGDIIGAQANSKNKKSHEDFYPRN